MQSKSQKQEKSKSIDEEELRAELRKIIETGGSWNEEELSSR
jgi:phage-related minor tail protein